VLPRASATPTNRMQRIPLFLSVEHACGYLPAKVSRNAYVDPDFRLSPARYGALIEQGFRRSGNHVYRPHCALCKKCLAARVPVEHFRPHRSQQRCLTRNRDLSCSVTRTLTHEHYSLFQRYIDARHAGEGMDGDSPESFHAFLECSWGETQFWEFRLGKELLSVAVVDVLPEALSAVYTFFDPSFDTRGLGTLAVLRLIERAQALRLPYVYLGYWVEGSRKMDYKRRFQPLEVFDGETWAVLSG
jgi:arginyl-tRNA--protein-N-Asp/Glu arginylyltransferase